LVHLKNIESPLNMYKYMYYKSSFDKCHIILYIMHEVQFKFKWAKFDGSITLIIIQYKLYIYLLFIKFTFPILNCKQGLKALFQKQGLKVFEMLVNLWKLDPYFKINFLRHWLEWLDIKTISSSHVNGFDIVFIHCQKMTVEIFEIENVSIW